MSRNVLVTKPVNNTTNKSAWHHKSLSIIRNVLFAVAVLVLCFILVSVLFTRAAGETPEVFGFRLYIIRSSSMSPTLEVDDIILSKHPSDTSNLDVGEIITFKTEAGTIITHRIIAIVTSQDGRIAYQTQGDNPINSPDLRLVTPDQVQAVFVFKFPGFQ